MLKALKKIKQRVESFLCDVCNRLRQYKVFHYTLFQVYFLAVTTTIIIEILSKRSLIKAARWMIMHPLIFVVNILVVAISYAACIFLRRKYSWYFLMFLLWLTVGVVDCIVISCRNTPFTFGDLKVLPTVITIIPVYLRPWQIVLAVAAIILAVAVLIYGFLRLPVIKCEMKRMNKAVVSILIICINLVLITLSMRIGIVAVNFTNIRNAYQEYGLAYSYTNSIFNTGISKPSGYSKAQVNQIISGFEKPNQPDKEDLEHPNIIFVQLESFFNVNRLNGVKYTENPIPYMTYLYEHCDTGLLGVPSISAGTANTEFEVLTGMNMKDFGPGEYPYKTVLSEDDVQCESIANNLKTYGYSTHGIHNNTASFYNRNIVFPHLGIDTFTPIEYMTGIERNQLQWCKDKILTENILKALDSTHGEDFVFAVSVQGHGSYPDEDLLTDSSLLMSIEGISGEIGEFNFAYYLEQIKEMDAFVKELVTALEKREEPTVLVLYGDHLPGFDFDESDLKNGTLYDTEYVIWRNFGKNEHVTKNLKSHQLSAYVMSMLGFDSGVITKLHQNRDKYTEEEYYDSLKILEYDMLYGDKNCWNGVVPYKMPELKYGYDEIKITAFESIKNKNEKDMYYGFVRGKGFNEFSTVYVNEKEKLETIYVNETTLFVPEAKLKPGDRLYVSQSSGGINVFPATLPYLLNTFDMEVPYTGSR